MEEFGRMNGHWMKKWALALAIGVLSAASLAQSGGLAQLVDLNLDDADMLAATRALTDQTGLEFVIAPSDQPFRRITLNLRGVTAEQAIEKMVFAAGGWMEIQDGVIIIHQGVRPAVPVTPRNPVPRPVVVRKIQLQKADPETVFRALTNQQILDPMHGLREINRFTPTGLHTLARPDVMVLGGTAVTNSVTPATNPGVLAVPPATTGETANGVLLPGETARQLGPAGGPGGGLGGLGPGGGGLAPGGGLGAPGAGAGAAGALQPGTGLVPEDITYIGFDPTDNSIIVRGTDEAIRQLQQYVALFDVAPRQVVIKVEFVTTSSSISRSLGFDWLYQRGAVFAGNRPGSFARVGDPIFLNWASGNVVTRMRTLLLEGQGKVVQAPLVRTLNNQPAIVQQSIQTTIFINQVILGQGGITTVPQPVPMTVSTGLSVRPRINEDGTVTMFLTPQVSDLGQVRRGPDGAEVPDVLQQVIQVVARVRDGETIALGGLTRKSTTQSTARFPILSDLPIIGQFFRAQTRERSDQELIVFVTPMVVEDDEFGLGSP
jgi:type II secretory pathway component GspD/PulD (secretin)